MTLVLVLHAFDGKPQPQFGSTFGAALTLNTIIAIISASAKAALLLPAAECISQYKWFWFQKDYRDMGDMETFDGASRGLWGGFELLWKSKLRFVHVVPDIIQFEVH